ncbi:metal ABC transporter solute-binding protein, Zn/Mn family [Acetomicrobium sp. S15 = DSM 107314]|uniref:metal ABC transporter solute-binding protein, Zn/Mn family n=1 Tax=Acetomicrobium sp. S15 = DSM 107314 TaxID=2529858 RepID=UPI001E3C5B3E|nr:zinc ABC transporter substrate-binding protein [Acetomicrobium sp. S15 = DSM 107314]
MRRFVSAVFFLLAFVVAEGTIGIRSASSEEALLAFVSVPPMAYFVERIGGSGIKAEALIRPGDDPHTFEPKPKQMAALSSARAYFATGFPFEANLLPRIKATNPKLVVVDAAYGIPFLEDGDHEGDRSDPHIWTSPLAALRIADNVYRGLASIDHDGIDVYRERYRTFLKEITDLDAELWETLKGVRGKKFIVFHPAWGYFANDYGLIQVSIEAEGKEPKGADLARLIEMARLEGTKAIFVSPQHSKAGAKVIADAIGANLIDIDPLAEDWTENLKAVSKILAEAM